MENVYDRGLNSSAGRPGARVGAYDARFKSLREPTPQPGPGSTHLARSQGRAFLPPYRLFRDACPDLMSLPHLVRMALTIEAEFYGECFHSLNESMHTSI